MDVAFEEDACRICKGNTSQNFSLLQQIALNRLGQDKATKAGIAAKHKKASWDDDLSLSWLSHFHAFALDGSPV